MKVPCAAKLCASLLFAALLASCPAETPPRENVLLITVDTLGRDHLGCYGYPRATTPHFDRLAAEGVLFEACSSPRGKTSPALASLFTGTYPHEHGVRELLEPLAADRPVLAECFRRAGYQTAAVVGNFVLQERYSGFSRGFDHYVETLPSAQGVPPDDVPQRTAGSLALAARVALGLAEAPALDEDGRPFEPAAALFSGARPWFLWLHAMDPHGAYEPPAQDRVFAPSAPRWVEPQDDAPATRKVRRRVSAYNVPDSARRADGAFDAQAVIDLYDGEIRAADRELGRVIEELRARGELARTWIVLTADHGESLGEHDYWFEHGFYACEATCAIPLIVRPPDRLSKQFAGARRVGTLSLADLAPTLAQWLDLSSPPLGSSPVRGVSRAGLLQRDDPQPFATFSEKVEAVERLGSVQIKSVRFRDHKLVQRWARIPATDPAPAHGEAQDAAAAAAGRAAPRGVLQLLGEELHDLARDPLERVDLMPAPGAEVPLELQQVLADLRARLLEFGACDKPFEELAERLRLRRQALEEHDPEALRRLKSLGY